MSGRRSRRKGAQYERDLANDLILIWPNAKRGIGQTRSGGEVPDVDGTPYWIEAKRCKRTNIHGAMKQASEATDGRPPLAITKRDREPALVTMEYATWFELMLCLSEAGLLGKLPQGLGLGRNNREEML